MIKTEIIMDGKIFILEGKKNLSKKDIILTLPFLKNCKISYLFFSHEKDHYSKEYLENIHHLISLENFENEYSVYIFLQAELIKTLFISSMLKLFEQLPNRTYIILQTENQFLLEDTIRSRSITLNSKSEATEFTNIEMIILSKPFNYKALDKLIQSIDIESKILTILEDICSCVKTLFLKKEITEEAYFFLLHKIYELKKQPVILAHIKHLLRYLFLLIKKTKDKK